MRRGIVPGVIAGYIFLAYAGPGMQDMIGGVISADSFVGFILHIIISIVIGALYTGVFMQYVDLGNPLVNIVVGGLIYGLIWWIVGGKIIMPLLNGSAILQLHIGPSFYGHIIFGHTLAFVVVLRDAALGMGGRYLTASNLAEFPRREHPAGYVYNAYDDSTGLSKIGRTIDPEQRLRQLRQKHGKQLRYSRLNESDNAPKDEQRLHKRLDHLKVDKDNEKEWFNLS